MAVLGTEDRARIWRALMRYWSDLGETITDTTKAELQTLVDETDAWLDDNRNSYAASLTANNLTGAQIALVLACVALLRKGEVALLKRALSVDTEA